MLATLSSGVAPFGPYSLDGWRVAAGPVAAMVAAAGVNTDSVAEVEAFCLGVSDVRSRI